METLELTPEKLVEYRTKSGLSQQEIAEFVGVSQTSYSYWELGKTKPKHSSVLKLLEVFDGRIQKISYKKPEDPTYKKDTYIPLIPIDAMAGIGHSEYNQNLTYIKTSAKIYGDNQNQKASEDY
jgi:transcriptional regulator with XRE-family HTH domain